ncbi:hypothetical protein L218DRAFT_103122 [Marasmius fiardii PR-910]|nr:hypothetical protein L218DRAFT_103122 [Marasmius fiardii PR-910]
MPLPSIPNVRVVVRLPENRPAVPPNDPPKIEWTSEKADILWKVIEKSRTSGGTDWKGLAVHLEVPLPYLLYRAHARFQEDLKGLQDVAVTSPTSGPSIGTFDASEEQPVHLKKTSRMGGSTGSSRTTIRARLNSLGSHNNQNHTQNQSYNHNHSLQKKTTTSSSTLTLQGPVHPHKPLLSTQVITSDDETSDSEDEEMLREEETERRAEEQEVLDRKLMELQRMMTSDALGLVAPRKRYAATTTSRAFSPRSSVSASASASVSSASASTSSPQGSIPEIPTSNGSSSSRSYSHSPRQLKSPSSPPALSPRSALGQRYGRLMGRSNSEQESVNGSEASSFSDINASLSGSALESALLSNIRGGGGSRFSNFARSRFGGGRSAIPH